MITGIKLLRRNMVSNAVGVIVPALAWLVAVPILVHRLGDKGYGVYTIAISFAGILGFLELGLTSAATKFIAEVDIRNNPEKLEKIISSNFTLYVGLGSGVILLCYIFGPLIARFLFHGTGLPQEELALIVNLIGIILALTLLRNALSAVPMGFQRYDVYNAIQISYAVILVLVQIVIVLQGGQIIALLLGNAAVLVISLIGFILATIYLIPNVRLIRYPDSYFIRILFSFGIYMMLINITSTIIFNLDKVIVGWILDSESVTYYAIPTQIALKFHNGLAVFASFLFPLASEVQSIGDKATLIKIYLHGMRLIMLIDGLAMVFLGVFARDILTVWIDTDFALVSAPILTITAIAYLMFAMSIIPFHVLLGMGHPREFAILNIIAMFCVTLLLSLGLFRFGLIGGAIGVMIGMGVMIILPGFVQRLLGITWKTAFMYSYGRIIFGSICGIFISTALPQNLLIRLIYFIGFTLALLAFGNPRREDWHTLKKTVRQMISHTSVFLRSIWS